MSTQGNSVPLDERSVEKLPYTGPPTRRIYVISYNNGKEITQELFVQRFDAFTTDLLHEINRLKNKEITEIRYKCGFYGMIRIYLDEKGAVAGEFFSESKEEFTFFKNKLLSKPEA